MEWTSEIARENYKYFRRNQSLRSPWELDASRFEDFRYGSHFSGAEINEMLMFRQAPTPISITTAICDTAEAMMIANEPTISVAPIMHPYDETRTDTSKKVAQIYNYLIKKSWYDSLGSLQFDRVIRDYSNVGHGLFYIVPRNEFGEFNVDIKHLNWRYFYPGYTKDPLYRDMDDAVIAMNVSQEYAYKFVRGIEDITREQFKDEWVNGAVPLVSGTLDYKYAREMQKDHMMFIHRIMLEDQYIYYVIPRKKDVNYNGELRYRIFTDLTPELKQLEAEGKVKILRQYRFVLTEYTSVGGLGYKKVYPIEDMNIVPAVYDHRDSPYPLGRIWYLYPLQRAINKFIMVAILNGSLMNSVRVMGEENSIVDEDEFVKKFAMPGAFLKYKLPTPGFSKPPIIIAAQPLSDAWLAMPRYLSYIMEYISGIFGVMMGDSRNTPDIFSTVASLQSAGGVKMKRRMAQLDVTLSRVGEITAKFYREYAPPNGFSTIINSDGKMEEPQLYNVLEADPEDNKKVRVKPETDLRVGFSAVRFTSQGSAGFESGTEAALLTNLATQLKTPELIPLILKRINMPDVDKVIDNMSIVNKQGATIQQMQGVIKDLEGRTKILANQVQQRSFETETAKFSAKLDKVLNQIKTGGNNGR